MDAKEVSNMLAQRAEAVCQFLYPEGRKSSGEFMVADIGGSKGRSLKIRLTGPKAGLWCDFSDTQYKGDLIDLWRVRQNLSFVDALAECKRWLGVDYEPAVIRNSQPPKRPKTQRVADAQPDVMGWFVNERKLSPQTVQAYRIGSEPGKIVFRSYRNGELVMLKRRPLALGADGKKADMPTEGEAILFGWQVIPADADELVITEGEIDAMTLYEAGIPAVSLPYGGGTGAKHKWVENDFETLQRFRTIYLCLDNDAEGDAAVEDLLPRLGYHRCKIMVVPGKDANECWLAGTTAEEFQRLKAMATEIDNPIIQKPSTLKQKVRELRNPDPSTTASICLPWKIFNGEFLFRPAEITLWMGYTSHGKSEVIGNTSLSLGARGNGICIASLEFQPAVLFDRLLAQATGMKDPSPEYEDAAWAWMDDWFCYVNKYGKISLPDLLEAFEYARRKYNVSHFVIDSLMTMEGIKGDDYAAQTQFVQALNEFKVKFQAHIHLVAHARKPPGINAEKHPPNLYDTKGASEIVNLVDNVLVVWKNKAKLESVPGTEDYDEIQKQPDGKLVCEKQRNGSWIGAIPLWFDRDSRQFVSRPGDSPKRYVKFSNAPAF